MRKLLLAASLLALVASPALAVDTVANVGLSNIRIGAGAGQLGNSGLNNSAAVSGSRITATTRSSTTFSAGLNQNPAANGGLGGVGGGFAETTQLSAGGQAVNNNSLSGSGTIQGTYASRTESGALNPQSGQYNTATVNANGRLDGSFTRIANSNAATGLNGVSYAQTTGPGTVQNTVNGSAVGVGAAVTGSAGLR